MSKSNDKLIDNKYHQYSSLSIKIYSHMNLTFFLIVFFFCIALKIWLKIYNFQHENKIILSVTNYSYLKRYKFCYKKNRCDRLTPKNCLHKITTRQARYFLFNSRVLSAIKLFLIVSFSSHLILIIIYQLLTIMKHFIKF